MVCIEDSFHERYEMWLLPRISAEVRGKHVRAFHSLSSVIEQSWSLSVKWKRSHRPIVVLVLYEIVIHNPQKFAIFD